MAGTKTKAHAKAIGSALHNKFINGIDNRLLEKMASMYLSGASITEVSAAFEKPLATTHRWLKLAGVKTRPLGSSMKGKQWSEARRAATPEKKKADQVIVDGKEIKGAAMITNRSIGNKSRSSHGYVTVHIGRKKKQYEHILVAEKALGRGLKKGEVVHHINCNKTDNRPENLLICTIGYHRQLHARMKKHPYWTNFHD